MNKLTNLSALLILLVSVLLFCPAKSFSQKTLNWDFNVPPIENVDSVYMQIIDNGNNIVFNDSAAVNGTKNDIPTPIVTVDQSGFNVETYGSGNNAKVKINTAYSQDVKIEMFDLTGRLVNQYSQKVMQGENLFDIDLGRYSSSQYIMKVSAKEGMANSRITNVGGNKKVSTASVRSLENMMTKSAVSNDWKIIMSHPRLLTDTFYVAPSDVMDLSEDLYSMPNISGQVLDIFNMVGENGNRKISDGRFIDEVGISGMKVFFDGMQNNFAITNSGGYFNLRPDKRESVDGVLRDTLYILNHFNSVDVYQFKMPFAVKSGEILDVNRKPSRLITMPITQIDGQDYAGRDLSMDFLDELKHVIEIEKYTYPQHPEYKGSVVNMDGVTKPLKVFLDRENTTESYADTIMAGYKNWEVVSGMKFIETTNKDEANFVNVMFDNVDYNKDHYMHIELREHKKTVESWNFTKAFVYLQNNRGNNFIHWVATHEPSHAFAHNSDDGHGHFMNSIYGVKYPKLKVELLELDEMITKAIQWPMPNPNFTHLVKETKYDN